jgi:hypothetical protein
MDAYQLLEYYNIKYWYSISPSILDKFTWDTDFFNEARWREAYVDVPKFWTFIATQISWRGEEDKERDFKKFIIEAKEYFQEKK